MVLPLSFVDSVVSILVSMWVIVKYIHQMFKFFVCLTDGLDWLRWTYYVLWVFDTEMQSSSDA